MLRADERPHGVRGDRSEGCGNGFWGGRRLSLAGYVAGTGPMEGACREQLRK